MDFWSRLIGGVGTPNKQSTSNDPKQRLARFKKLYSQVLDTWQKTRSIADDQHATEVLRSTLQRLTSTLRDESRSPAPHLCLSFAASTQIYSTVSSIGATCYNEDIVWEAVALFAALIDSEEEEFLSNGRFAQSLINFVGKILSVNASIGEDTRAETIELLFGIAAKIRLEPEILPVWFSLRSKPGAHVLLGTQKAAEFAGVTQKEDFPLCYHLIDHVHHEGRIGDFARTGLLYIFESAAKSPELEQWIVESDLATLMATGLGALYSQLSRKLSIILPEVDMPIVLIMSDYMEMQPSTEAEGVYSPLLKSQVATFLSYLTFWQDVLEHCSSVEVRNTLIDHFQVLFLQQLLYPSLLESSDVDGGSSVAVLTYLRYILDSLDHPELVHMILHYLLALSDIRSPLTPATPKSPVAVKRRVSLMKLSQTEDEDDKLNPSLFNLVDLILNSIRSPNPQTKIAALKLVTVIVSKNHAYAVGTLLRVVAVHMKEPRRTVGSLQTELETYLQLAGDIGGEDGVDEAYENHLKDMQHAIETHPCSLEALNTFPFPMPNITIPDDILPPGGPAKVDAHHLNANDPLFTSLTTSLATFLTNNVEANLALTEVIVMLSSCCHLHLEGWFTVEPSNYSFPPSDADPNASITSLPPRPKSRSYSQSGTLDDIDFENFFHLARRHPSWSPSHTPHLLRTLKGLSAQIAILRSHIPNFDILVANRKQAFRVHEEIEEAMRAPPPLLPSSETKSRALSPSSAAGTPNRYGADTPSGGGGGPHTPQRATPSSAIRRVFMSGGDSTPRSPSRAASPRGRVIPPTPLQQQLGTSPPVTPMRGRPNLGPTGTPRTPLSRSVSPIKSNPGTRGVTRDVVEGQKRDVERASIGRRIRFRIRKGDVAQLVWGDENFEEAKPVDTLLDTKKAEGSDADVEPNVKKEEPAEKKTKTGTGRESKGSAASRVADKSKDNKSKDNKSRRRRSTLDKSSLKASEKEKEADVQEKNEIEEEEVEYRDCSLSHLLTNIVLLQSFILELVALMQSRATLFADREVRLA